MAGETGEMTPAEKLENLKEFTKLFKEQVPSSPHWYGLIDRAVEILLDARIETMARDVVPKSTEAE